MDSVSSANIGQVLDEYLQSSDHPDLQIYRRGVTDPHYLSILLWRMKQFCDLGGFYGKDILEVGCGFGWDAVALALTGNNRVTASDILPSMIDGVSQCLSAMDARGKTLPVTAVQADICEVDFPDNSFDGIFTSEAIEHVHDLNRMFANCYRLLKPAGTALIVNDSNRYNGAACAHSWEGWTDRDESWEHVDWLKTEVRPVEHADAKPYGVMREEIIRSVAPDMAADDLARLRHATAGMIKPEIEAAVARFEAAGELPLRDEFGWCRNPETGEYSERLLDPFELRDMLRAVGFRVQLRHMFRKMPFKLLNGVAFRPLNERLFAMRPMFVLVAKKPDR